MDAIISGYVLGNKIQELIFSNVLDNEVKSFVDQMMDTGNFTIENTVWLFNHANQWFTADFCRETWSWCISENELHQLFPYTHEG
jgi:hypothetical protein